MHRPSKGTAELYLERTIERHFKWKLHLDSDSLQAAIVHARQPVDGCGVLLALENQLTGFLLKKLERKQKLLKLVKFYQLVMVLLGFMVWIMFKLVKW